jgi:HEPN domain-containing protein
LEEHEISVQKIHNLITLYAKVEKWLPEGIDTRMLKILDSLYIEARYPGELGLLPNGKSSQQDADDFYQFAVHVFDIVSE